MKIKFLILNLGAALLWAAGGTALSQTTNSINVVNNSFETQSVTAGSYAVETPTGWAVSGPSAGVVALVNPASGDARFNSYPPPGLDGVNYCQIYSTGGDDSGTVYQDLGSANKYQPGVTYTLTANFGWEQGHNPPDSRLVFYNSSLLPIAYKSISAAGLTANSFVTESVTYTATGTEGGNGDIVVGFTTSGAAQASSFDFDNVSLVAVNPPANVYPFAGAVIYSYDSLNRLTNVDYGNGSVISYTYDLAGNRLTYSAVVFSDTTPPTIAITSPTSGPAYTNSTATIYLSGTASDNVGVTLVTWQNYSAGISVGVGDARGTNSWSIIGIPLQYGVNNISVTAYDAAGNSSSATLTVSFTTGGTGITTNSVFTDTGSGSTIDPTKWITSGNTVSESAGTMQVLTTVTDQGGLLTSLPIPINLTGDITITRNVRVHYANNNSVSYICMKYGGVPLAAVFYANYTSTTDGSMPRYGIFIGKNVGWQTADTVADAYITLIRTNQQASVSPDYSSVLWDTWFNEKIIYSPVTGILQLLINNQSVGSYNVGIMTAAPNPTLQLGFQAWGWYTGHEQDFSNLVVSQVAPATTSTQFNQIAGYSRMANGVFRLTMNGPVGSNYVIYASSDLINWIPLYTNTVPPAGLITFVDPSAAGYPQRFYSAVPYGTAVTVQPPPTMPQLNGIGLTAGGQFQFSLNGPAGSNYVVQVSTNLVNWVNLSTNAIPSGGVNVFDFPIQNTQSQIFYRALPAQ